MGANDAQAWLLRRPLAFPVAQRRSAPPSAPASVTEPQKSEIRRASGEAFEAFASIKVGRDRPQREGVDGWSRRCFGVWPNCSALSRRLEHRRQLERDAFAVRSQCSFDGFPVEAAARFFERVGHAPLALEGRVRKLDEAQGWGARAGRRGVRSARFRARMRVR